MVSLVQKGVCMSLDGDLMAQNCDYIYSIDVI